jgi:hypothetical protein
MAYYYNPITGQFVPVGNPPPIVQPTQAAQAQPQPQQFAYAPQYERRPLPVPGQPPASEERKPVPPPGAPPPGGGGGPPPRPRGRAALPAAVVAGRRDRTVPPR